MRNTRTLKALSLVLSVLMLAGSFIIPGAAYTNEDWKIDGSYVILSGESLLGAIAASDAKLTELVYDADAGKSYVKITANTGKRPQVQISQSKSGVNLAEYDYYYISYYQSQAASNLDMTFRADTYPEFSEMTHYEQWSVKGHPEASNGAWKTSMKTRAEFYGQKTAHPEYAPIPALTNQYLCFKPWSSDASEGSYFGLEYVACFKTEEQYKAFAEKAAAGEIPAESLAVISDGAEITELTATKGLAISVKISVSPAIATSTLKVTSNNEEVVKIVNNKPLAVGKGTAVLTYTVNDGITGATPIVKTLNVTVNEEDTLVFSAASLAEKVGFSGYIGGKVTVIDDDAAERRYLHVEINADATGKEFNGIQFSVNELGVNAKNYPYVKIGFKPSMSHTADFNVGFTQYKKSDNTLTNNRFWGPKPGQSAGVYQNYGIKYTQYNGSEKEATVTPWNGLTNDSVYNYLLLKHWSSNAVKAGDSVDYEYIAFFSNESAMNSFVYTSKLDSFELTDLSLQAGEVAALPVSTIPSGAYYKLDTITSSAPDVVRVEGKKLIALKAGSSTITASTTSGYSDSCTVTVSEAPDYSKYIFDRDELGNAAYRLKNDKKLSVVYLGGSVTAGAGATESQCWRGLTGAWLKSAFPDADIELHNSAMGGSGSMLGAFRLQDDVLAYKPDLVFVEFAVNDSYSGHAVDGTVKTYYETILRNIRVASPNTEIISIFVCDQSHLGTSVNYDLHPVAQLHNEVAEYYGVTGINVGRAMSNTILSTGSKWSDYVTDSVHPGPSGYKVYADVICSYLFDKLIVNKTPDKLEAHSVPSGYLDADAAKLVTEYVRVSPDIFESVTGWNFYDGKVYSNLATDGYMVPAAADNSFTYKFTGTGIAFYMEFAGGKYYVDYSIDGGATQRLYVTDTNHPFNKLAKKLDNGEHTITFSYRAADGNGGVNSNLKLTRLLVSHEKVTDQLGDINGDGVIDSLDYLVFAKALGGVDGYMNRVVKANADLNSDDTVSAKDSIILARHLAGWRGYETLPIIESEDKGADHDVFAPAN